MSELKENDIVALENGGEVKVKKSLAEADKALSI